MKLGPSSSQSQMLWGFVFPTGAPWCSDLFLSPLCAPGIPSSCGQSRGSLPDWTSALLTFLHVTSSLHLVVEFILPVFGLFSRLFTLVWILSSCIYRMSWARVLLLCYRPQKLLKCILNNLAMIFLKLCFLVSWFQANLRCLRNDGCSRTTEWAEL